LICNWFHGSGYEPVTLSWLSSGPVDRVTGSSGHPGAGQFCRMGSEAYAVPEAGAPIDSGPRLCLKGQSQEARPLRGPRTGLNRSTARTLLPRNRSCKCLFNNG
jgi:hypothetical protein